MKGILKKENNFSIGSWITLGHLSIAEILSGAGFDWLCIDIEHTVIDYYELQVLISGIESKGVIPYVRVGENNPRILKRVLDAGAKGVIIPMIKSADEAQDVISYVKYPPQGSRGVGLARAQGYGFAFDDYRDDILDQIKIIIQVEHIDAIKNLDSILSIKGIDCTFIGPYDLSASMGKPGDYNDKEVKEAISTYEKKSKQYNIPMGFHVVDPDPNQVLDKIKSDYSMIAFSTDAIFLGSVAREKLAAIFRDQS